MTSPSTVTSGLYAALLLARGRPDGVVLIAGDRNTTRRSFWSIAFCIPSVICRLLIAWAASGLPPDTVQSLARELVIFILGWLLFVEATHRLAPLIGRAERWERFIAIWNWCNVIEGVLIIIGAVPGLLGAPPLIAEAAELATIGWALWLEWYATRLAFNVGPLTATGLVLLDQSIGIALAAVAVSVSG